MNDQENKATGEPTSPVNTPDTNPAGEGVKPEAEKPKVVNKSTAEKSKKAAERAAKKKAAEEAAEPQPAAVPETVVLKAADPKMVLEVSIGSRFWKGHEITVPKELEGEVRRLLEGAGYWLKN